MILLKGRSREGFESTRSMIDTLIVYAINTGLITAIFSILTFVFSLTNPNDLYYGSFALIGAKLYSISFLAMLNSRKAIGRRAELVDDFESRPGGQLTPFSARTGSGGSTNLQSNLVIAMPPQDSSGSVTVDGKDRYSTGDRDATELSTRVVLRGRGERERTSYIPASGSATDREEDLGTYGRTGHNAAR
ncbi:hypothetical protein C8Q80DRAFT_481758 [Daedaleopsis nitida]|nr:hypothetical protein C8Q80DRAFT_481758 [Daedaleopsis nitida]